MTAATVDAPAPPPIERDHFGRPLVIPPSGGKPKAYTRCTTYVDPLDDKYNLQQWEKRNVAIGLAERPDLLLAVSATDRADKAELNRITEQAQEAARAHAAATTGTALHALTERLDRGQPLGVIPEAYQADLDAYREATAGLDHLLIEQFTVQDDLKIGGTPDRIATYQGQGYVADVKTGGIEYGALKIAMQLAVYAHSQPYDHTTGERTPYPVQVDQERAIVIHLPAGEGRCELVWIDIARGWQAVQTATEVRRWRRARNLLTKWARPAIEFDALQVAVEAITHASDLDQVRDYYRNALAAGLDRDKILAACLARRGELQAEDAR